VIEKTARTSHAQARNQPPPSAVEPSRERPLFTKRSLCAYLVISPSTLDRLVRAGRLAAHRIGGQVRFDPDDVNEFIDATKE
jgi:excisionase family DNA binding protein